MPMKQQTLAMAANQKAGFEQFRKPTMRDEFLQTMNAIMPWADLCSVIEPIYPKGVGGRPPIGLERMLIGPERLAGGAYGIEASVAGVAAVSLASEFLIALARKRGRVVPPYWKQKVEAPTGLRAVAAGNLL